MTDRTAHPHEFTPDDLSWMRRAFDLAKLGEGSVSPNPMVGAVIVKDGRIVGEGFHRRYGGRHAEAEAIGSATGSLAGATLYCTLEPCCYTSPEKHQPPCTDLIVRSGLGRVVIANADPNPKVNGEGVRRLREAGIEVAAGLLSEEGERLNEVFFTCMREGRPFVHLKIAQSLDGRIAAVNGDSRWITDEAARKRVHAMRAASDAVIVGIGTVAADDPGLTVRDVPGKNPFRVVLDSSLSVSPAARIFDPSDPERTLVFCTSAADPEKRGRIEATGARVFETAAGKNGGVDLPEVLRTLLGLGLRSVLVEGGAGVFTSFLREGLCDRLSVFVAPVLIGKGIEAVGDLGVEFVKHAKRLTEVEIETIGDQVLVRGRLRKAAEEENNVHGHR